MVSGASDMDGVRTDIVMRGAYSPQREASFDLCIIDADAPSYCKRPTTDVLASHEKSKKRHHLKATQERSMTFTPLAVTCDGVWGREAESFLFGRLIECLQRKTGWREKGQGAVTGWLRARLTVSLVRGVSLCLRGGGGSAMSITLPALLTGPACFPSPMIRR